MRANSFISELALSMAFLDVPLLARLQEELCLSMKRLLSDLCLDLESQYGDIAKSLALPVAWLALRGQGNALIWAWNAFGMLDLVAALAFGIISANGSPLQIIHAGEGSQAVQMLPWSLIPTVLVPMFLIVHGVIFARLARAAARAAS